MFSSPLMATSGGSAGTGRCQGKSRQDAGHPETPDRMEQWVPRNPGQSRTEWWVCRNSEQDEEVGAQSPQFWGQGSALWAA